MRKNKIGWRCLLALLTITIIIFLLTKPTQIAEAEIKIEPTPVPKLPRIMDDIAYAESHNDQTKVGYNYRYKIVDGKKVKYLWSKDIGKYQINDFYNQKPCADAGFDIYTEHGNAGCALLLYNESGTTPWNASKYCWSDIVACKAKRGGAYK